MSENITLLKDESLGGVMREYREVKRKASVGERVKMTKSGIKLKAGEVYTVPKVAEIHENGIGFLHDGWGTGPAGEYVALEPTEILVIDGARYRMVDRKAAVGERVIIASTATGSGSGGGEFFRVGDIATSLGGEDWFDFNVNKIVNGDGKWSVAEFAYRVLEPVRGAYETAPELSARPTLLSSRPAPEQAAENIAALAARVSGLEAQVNEMAAQVQAVIEAGNPAELSFSEDDVEAASKVVTAPKSPQQIRDEIVERAKADVKALSKTHWCGNGDVVYARGIALYSAEFVVNRDKRTVACVLRLYGTKIVSYRGIAKCAPNDVFNAHLGKSIALHRALGLEVPAEYLSVPNPEEVRVGDVVEILGNFTEGICHYYDLGDIGKVIRAEDGEVRVRGVDTKDMRRSKSGYCQIVSTPDVHIIDDSRMSESEDHAAARKEVAA
ncbi:hypothetical protein [Paenibacillus chibensis]|uniref:hypothetical protein n=1 Tax=Paenibacillus chibensis TaxID=59846 RepID=UPI000FD739A0|nr:hypothetical protein [Paenibacillus chibensis]MEC0370023.1 hypothetical protein [Paenibacillus chibensis]